LADSLIALGNISLKLLKVRVGVGIGIGGHVPVTWRHIRGEDREKTQAESQAIEALMIQSVTYVFVAPWASSLHLKSAM
jgi:hypothetical protein